MHTACNVCLSGFRNYPSLFSSRLFSNLTRFFFVDTVPMPAHDRWLSAIGAFVGVALVGLLLLIFPIGSRWLLAPIGASAVILFVMPHSPVAAPWPVVGGYAAGILSAALCLSFVPFPPLSAALAVAISIWLMGRLHCVHPPGGAAALLLATCTPTLGPEWRQWVVSLTANVAILFGASIIYNRITGRWRYAHPAAAPIPHHRAPIQLTHEDIATAIRTRYEFIDVGEEELLALYELASEHALERVNSARPAARRHKTIP